MAFRVIPVPGRGAEDVVVALHGPHAGWVFTGTEDGAVYRVSPDGDHVERVVHTGGRPLGLELMPDGRLLVCDARRGLLAVDTTTAAVDDLVAEAVGVRLLFCNNAAVAADGTIYFSDSSSVHPIEEWKADLVELTRTGRLLRRAPDGAVEVLLDGLAFANGVALSADESYLAVAETATRDVVRLWLTGPRAGSRDVLVANLPGFPDNIARGSDGLIWVTIASPRDRIVEMLQRTPRSLRRQVTRIPGRLQPGPKRSVHVQAYDDDGRLVRNVQPGPQEHGGRYHMVTGVREHHGRVWLGSLHESAIAVLDL